MRVILGHILVRSIEEQYICTCACMHGVWMKKKVSFVYLRIDEAKYRRGARERASGNSAGGTYLSLVVYILPV